MDEYTHIFFDYHLSGPQPIPNPLTVRIHNLYFHKGSIYGRYEYIDEDTPPTAGNFNYQIQDDQFTVQTDEYKKILLVDKKDCEDHPVYHTIKAYLKDTSHHIDKFFDDKFIQD